MNKILIFVILISGLIFTSFIKNKTRLLEKELTSLNNEINILSSNFNEASLDFQYLTTPKHISLLAQNFLYEDFSYYKESQIKKSIKPEKNLAILKQLKNDNTFLKQLKNDNTFIQLSTKQSANKKLNVIKRIDNTQLLIAKKINNKQQQRSKKIVISKKAQNWVGLQIIKALLGIPSIPAK